ncbi:MAG: hypothetical protein JNL41_16835 [Phenylobacterium sp.]|nr:hypothetical protein [Phenylobacterium sp.]
MSLPADRAEAHQRDLAHFQAVIMKAVRAADAEFLDPRGVEADAPAPPRRAGAAAKPPERRRPTPNPDPFNGRLAPPIDLPSWECDDDSS